jgi:hypothetical protein
MTRNLKQVGWLFWNTMNPDSKQFTTEPLSSNDIKAGYVAQPVYVDTREEP